MSTKTVYRGCWDGHLIGYTKRNEEEVISDEKNYTKRNEEEVISDEENYTKRNEEEIISDEENYSEDAQTDSLNKLGNQIFF